MQIVNSKYIEKLTPVQSTKNRASDMINELYKMKDGENLFISSEEWKKYKYACKSLRTWFTQRAKVSARNSIFKNSKYIVSTFEEGYVVNKTK